MNRKLFEIMDLMDENLVQIESIASVLLAVPGDFNMESAHGSVWMIQKLTKELKDAVGGLSTSRF